MINVICSKTLRLFKEDQRGLFSLSLLYIFISIAIMILSGAVPIVGISIVLVMTAGMRRAFLTAYQKKKVHTDALFAGFNNLKHVCLGMIWMFLKIVVWLLIPIIGIVFAIAKAYEYRFVPYILITRPEISAIDAASVSSAETHGFKANMFYTDLIILGAVAATEFILWIMSLIPIIGVIFAACMVIEAVLAFICLPFVRGIVSSAFYYEVFNKNIHPVKKAVVCPCCMKKTDGDAQYCSNCGEKLAECK